MSYRKNGVLSDMVLSARRIGRSLPPEFYALWGLQTQWVYSNLTNSTAIVADSSVKTSQTGTALQCVFNLDNNKEPTSVTLQYCGDANPASTQNYLLNLAMSTNYGGSQGGYTHYFSQGTFLSGDKRYYYWDLTHSGPDTCNSYTSWDNMSNFRAYGGIGAYKPVTGYYRVIASNTGGTTTSSWVRLKIQYCGYECNCLGQNCGCCDYEYGCSYCEDVTNCCCYDSNGDGVDCCEFYGCPDASCCCDRPDQCGTTYTCYGCSTGTDCCYYDCTNNPCDHNCAYQTCDTCYSDISDIL